MNNPQPKYILLDFDYFQLNKRLSEAKGWQLGQKTERSLSMSPRTAKVNIQYDAEGVEIGYDTKLVFPVSSQNQINFPELFEGLELISKSEIQYAEDDVKDFAADKFTSNELDWTIKHLDKVGDLREAITLTVKDNIASKLSLSKEANDILEKNSIVLKKEKVVKLIEVKKKVKRIT